MFTNVLFYKTINGKKTFIVSLMCNSVLNINVH